MTLCAESSRHPSDTYKSDTDLGSVLTDVILTDGRHLDAFGMANERPKGKSVRLRVGLNGRDLTDGRHLGDFGMVNERPKGNTANSHGGYGCT